MKGGMMFYHYTSSVHLPQILADGFIAPVESNVGSPMPMLSPTGPHLGPRVVWLLDTDRLDHDHGLTFLKDPLAPSMDKTEICITVDVQAVRWLDWAPAALMNHEWKDIFIKAGGGDEAAEHWYVWPAAIRRKRWVSVVNAKSGKELTRC